MFGRSAEYLIGVIGRRQIKDANDLPGKTIARQFRTEGGDAVLHFVDDSFVVFRVLRGPESGDEEVVICDEPLSAAVLRNGRLIDRPTYDHYLALESEDFKAEAEARNRKEYERLKAIFEGGSK